MLTHDLFVYRYAFCYFVPLPACQAATYHISIASPAPLFYNYICRALPLDFRVGRCACALRRWTSRARQVARGLARAAPVVSAVAGLAPRPKGKAKQKKCSTYNNWCKLYVYVV